MTGTPEDFGFVYLGRCPSCPTRPQWWRKNDLQLKLWRNGTWKLITGSRVLRFGNTPDSIYAELKDYFTQNTMA